MDTEPMTWRYQELLISGYQNRCGRWDEACSLFGHGIHLWELVLRDHKSRGCGKLVLDTDDYKYDDFVVELVVLCEVSENMDFPPFHRPTYHTDPQIDPADIAGQNWRKSKDHNGPVCEAYWVMLVEGKTTSASEEASVPSSRQQLIRPSQPGRSGKSLSSFSKGLPRDRAVRRKRLTSSGRVSGD